MKRGYFYNQYPNESLSNWDFVWYLGVVGRQYDATFLTRWNSDKSYEHTIAKGLVLVPVVEDISNMVNEVASFHMQLLQEVNVGLKSTKAPIIIDFLAAEKGKQFTYDNLVMYVSYIKDHWQPYLYGNKPLLRASSAQWAKWFKDNPNETANMLKTVEPLVVQWTSAVLPTSIFGYGYPKWWEYSTNDYAYMGKIAYDEPAKWDDSPNSAPVVVEPPVEEEPVEEEPIEEEPPVIEELPVLEPPVTEESVEETYEISLKIFGIPITGTMKRVK